MSSFPPLSPLPPPTAAPTKSLSTSCSGIFSSLDLSLSPQVLPSPPASPTSTVREDTPAVEDYEIEEEGWTESDEPLLRESGGRFVLFPIRWDKIWSFYKKAEMLFWTAEEVDLTLDLVEWTTPSPSEVSKLSSDQRNFVLSSLMELSKTDGSLTSKFSSEVQAAEARCFFGFQGMMENIHLEVFGMFLESFVRDLTEREKLWERGTKNEKKEIWISKWLLNDSTTFAERLIAFASIKTIFNSSTFARLLSPSFFPLPGLQSALKLINRDRTLHAGFAALLGSHLERSASGERVREIVMEAMEAELEELEGKEEEEMKRYVEFVADGVMTSFGHEKVFRKENPFGFMTQPTQEPPSNFSQSEIPKCRERNQEVEEKILSFDEDF